MPSLSQKIPRIDELSEDKLVAFLALLSQSPAFPLRVNRASKTVCVEGKLNSGMEFMVGQAISRLERFFGYNGYVDISRSTPRPFGEGESPLGESYRSFWRIENGIRGDRLIIHPSVLEIYRECANGSAGAKNPLAAELVVALRDRPELLKQHWARLNVEGDPEEQLSGLLRALTLTSEPCAARLKLHVSPASPSPRSDAAPLSEAGPVLPPVSDVDSGVR